MYRRFYEDSTICLIFLQERWDKEGGNKLHAIMPQIDVKYYSGCTNKKDEQSGRPPKIVAPFLLLTLVAI